MSLRPGLAAAAPSSVPDGGRGSGRADQCAGRAQDGHQADDAWPRGSKIRGRWSFFRMAGCWSPKRRAGSG